MKIRRLYQLQKPVLLGINSASLAPFDKILIDVTDNNWKLVRIFQRDERPSPHDLTQPELYENTFSRVDDVIDNYVYLSNIKSQKIGCITTYLGDGKWTRLSTIELDFVLDFVRFIFKDTELDTVPIQDVIEVRFEPEIIY